MRTEILRLMPGIRRLETQVGEIHRQLLFMIHLDPFSPGLDELESIAAEPREGYEDVVNHILHTGHQLRVEAESRRENIQQLLQNMNIPWYLKQPDEEKNYFFKGSPMRINKENGPMQLTCAQNEYKVIYNKDITDTVIPLVIATCTYR